jgi:ATP-binding cassette subfamily B protein
MFYRDASLCILDEPTAGLDPAAALEISESIEQHTRGRTTLIVSHDLSLWPFVDRVLVFEGGEIVADGPRAVVAQQSQWLSDLIGTEAERPGAAVSSGLPYWS